MNLEKRTPPLVLIVEDDEGDRDLAARAFANGEIACRVEYANDGQEAVDFFRNPNEDVPNLVLLDLKMPRMNGYEVLQYVRSADRTRHCPVVIFTSSSHSMDILNCYEGGANSYVRKSTEYHQYISRLQEVACYWLGLNESSPLAG